MISTLYRYPKLVSLIVFLIVLLAGEYMARLQDGIEREALRGQALARASTLRANVETELNSTIYLAIGLSGYLYLEPKLDEPTVNKLLSTVYQHGRHIKNIGLAPNNRITYLYPLKGNEAALGLQYEKIPAQWPGVRRAIEQRSTVVVGPIALAQGGYGIITRTPVFLGDGRYWGIVSMVVDVESLLDSVSESHANLGLVWCLRSASEAGDGSRYVYGDESLFETDSIRQQITLPGGSWDLAAMPDKSRALPMTQGTFSLRLLNAPMAVVMCLLVFLVLQERQQIHHMAVHDTLTGLPNRRLLFERMEQRIALGTRYDTKFCIVFVDLNRFKPINDTYGHRYGDRVLCELANRLKSVVRGSDTVARVGGDEFVILLPDTASLEGAAAVVTNLRRAIEEPVDSDKGPLCVGASMGIGCYPDNGTNPESLLAYADAAMYAEKEKRNSEE